MRVAKEEEDRLVRASVLEADA